MVLLFLPGCSMSSNAETTTETTTATTVNMTKLKVSLLISAATAKSTANYSVTNIEIVRVIFTDQEDNSTISADFPRAQWGVAQEVELHGFGSYQITFEDLDAAGNILLTKKLDPEIVTFPVGAVVQINYTPGGGTVNIGILDKGSLVAEYKLNGTGIDSSGQGNDGTMYNVEQSMDRFGKMHAMYFNGVDSYMAIPLTESLLINSTSSVTVSFWIQLDGQAKNSYGTILSSYSDTPGKFVLVIHSADDEDTTPPVDMGLQIITAIQDIGENEYTRLSNVPWQSTWAHIGIVYSNETVLVYVNGELKATGNYTQAESAGDPIYGCLLVGRNHRETSHSDQSYLKGTLDEFRIFKRALSAIEIGLLAAECDSD